MTTTKTLLLLRQTLARSRTAVELARGVARNSGMEGLANRCIDLLPDIEQAIIEADREIERLEAEQEMDIAAP